MADKWLRIMSASATLASPPPKVPPPPPTPRGKRKKDRKEHENPYAHLDAATATAMKKKTTKKSLDKLKWAFPVRVAPTGKVACTKSIPNLIATEMILVIFWTTLMLWSVELLLAKRTTIATNIERGLGLQVTLGVPTRVSTDDAVVPIKDDPPEDRFDQGDDSKDDESSESSRKRSDNNEKDTDDVNSSGDSDQEQKPSTDADNFSSDEDDASKDTGNPERLIGCRPTTDAERQAVAHQVTQALLGDDNDNNDTNLEARVADWMDSAVGRHLIIMFAVVVCNRALSRLS